MTGLLKPSAGQPPTICQMTELYFILMPCDWIIGICRATCMVSINYPYLPARPRLPANRVHTSRNTAIHLIDRKNLRAKDGGVGINRHLPLLTPFIWPNPESFALTAQLACYFRAFLSTALQAALSAMSYSAPICAA